MVVSLEPFTATAPVTRIRLITYVQQRACACNFPPCVSFLVLRAFLAFPVIAMSYFLRVLVQLNTKERVRQFFERHYSDAIPLLGGHEVIAKQMLGNPEGSRSLL